MSEHMENRSPKDSALYPLASCHQMEGQHTATARTIAARRSEMIIIRSITRVIPVGNPRAKIAITQNAKYMLQSKILIRYSKSVSLNI